MYRLLLVIMMVCVTAGSVVGDAPADGGKAELQRGLDELMHSDAAVREAARIRLMGLSRNRIGDFREVVERNQPLLPAQAAALREIVLQAYAAEEPYEKDRTMGFLGVELRTADLPGRSTVGPPMSGVLVSNRLIGFCGYRMLQDGDIILGLANQPELRTDVFNDLAALIRSFPAGSTIELEVLRRGQIIEVPITLDARPTALAQFGNLDTLRAVRFRRAYDYWQTHFAPLVDLGVS